MIYQCSACSRTSFEITCPWCESLPIEPLIAATTIRQQVPLDPSFFPEFQYQTKGYFKDLFGRKREQAQLSELLSAVLQKYTRLKTPYFANFFHTTREESGETDVITVLGARKNGTYSNRELFREVLVRKGFTELEELPLLLDKLLLSTGFNATYLGFSSEMSRHIKGSLLESLASWIAETGTVFRDDLSLFFYFLWDNNIAFDTLTFSEHALGMFGTPLIAAHTMQEWQRVCERLYFDILVERMAIKLAHFDPNRFVTMYQVDAMTRYDFEKFLAEIFQTAGYDVEASKLRSDQSADLFVSRSGKKIVVQVKNYSGSVGNAAVQEAISAKSFYACDEAIVVTNSDFTKSALDLAAAASVRLISRRELQGYLDDYNQRIIEQFRLVDAEALGSEALVVAIA